MEIDKSYLSYLVQQEVAKQTAEMRATLGNQQAKLLDKFYDLRDKVDDLTPESIKAPFGRDVETGNPLTEEQWRSRFAKCGEKWNERMNRLNKK